MAASSSSASLGEDAVTMNSAGAPNEDNTNHDNGKVGIKKVDEPPVLPDDSLLATPKTTPSKRNSAASKADTASDETESAMNYTPSPTSGSEKSGPSSPQASANQPVVSHVPVSVQQPVLQSEHSSLASPAATIIPQQLHVDVNGTTVQQQQQQHQQPVVEEKPSVVPTMVIHGTQGQVVTKRKGRFRLLQDSDAAAANLGGDVHSTQSQPTENASLNSGIEAAVSGAHPTRERTLSNTSTISATSVPAAAPPPSLVVPNALNVVDSPSHPHGAPVGKKKGRFVVIPGDVTDPSLLRQPFSGNQGVLRQQPLQPAAVATVTEQVVVSTPQATTMVVPQAAMVVTQQPILSHDVTQQQQVVQGGDTSQQQIPQNYPPHQVQQVPQYYTPQVMQVSYAQQPQHQVGPPVAGAAPSAPMQQARTSHSPVPPFAQQHQQQVYQKSIQPPTQIVVTEQPMPQPMYVVQTEDGRIHQMMAPQQQQQQQQQMVSIPEQQHAVSGLPYQQQATALSHDPQHQAQSISAPVPSTVEVSKPPQVVKPAAVKRPGIQRGTSGNKAGPVNVGFGKVFYFLEQMKLEVTEADRTIKNQGRDMKFLREKNKELEARSRDMERKWLEEKTAREALETKVKSLKKKVKELKGYHDANEGEKTTKDTQQNATGTSKSQSRSNSIDDAEHSGEKGVPIATAVETKPNSSEVEPLPISSKSKDVEGEKAEKSAKQPRSSSADASMTQPKTRAPLKPSAPAAGSTISSGADSSPPSKAKVKPAPEGPKSIQKGSEVSKADFGGPEAVPGAPSDKLSPLRQRGPQETTANKLASGKSQSARCVTAPTIDGTGGEAISKPIVTSSGDSLGSTSDFDPLRVTHLSNGDGAASIRSEPLSGGQPASSVVSFVTAPAPIQTVTFDPLSSSFQTGGMTVPAGMQPSPQHSHSHSMPNFLVQPNSMMMAYPLQQVQDRTSSRSSTFSHLPHGGWQQQQQQLPSQNHYLPTQYADTNLQSQQQYLNSQVAVAKQQQQQQPPSSAPGADPFDELASRRAPGTTN